MKRLFAVIFYCNFFIQGKTQSLINWQHKDLQKDSLFGISTAKAYDELLKGKKATTVIVAIVDSGIDTLQEDLRPVLWTDKNSGAHGWNYIGPETGKEDVALLTGNSKEFYDSLSYAGVPDIYRTAYQSYRKMAPGLADKIKVMGSVIKNLSVARQIAEMVAIKTGKSNPSPEDLKKYDAQSKDEKLVLKLLIERYPLYNSWEQLIFTEADHLINLAQYHIEHGLNVKNQEKDTATGNPDISPDALGLLVKPDLTAFHGTHVAGIIGAVRNNGKGMDGVADHVQIMMLKAIGNIRELRDKNLAVAIRYAVDKGAQIINFSFGKPYTWNKKEVDEAVKYAMEKDVLFIHGAGNNEEDLDITEHYPNPVYADKSGIAQAWIEVGASDKKGQTAGFSNYGKKDVDVFAPGVDIYSTVPYNQYQAWDGTSMATPVVAGLAALIREYYPKLTAVQVKEIIMQSVVKCELLKEKCVSGGVVNAYNALKLAANYK